MKRDLQWFKDNFIQNFKSYDIEYRYSPNGDFGCLTQINFDSSKLGGVIEFWGMGYTYIMLYDYENEVDLLNTMLLPDDKDTNLTWDKFEKLLNKK